MQKLLFLFVTAALLASCSDDNYKKTSSGLLYKIKSDGKGQPAKVGQILKFNFTQKVRDSLMQETYGGVPAYAMVDSVGAVYNAAELFTMLRKGDSVVVVLLGDSINKKFGLPPYIKKEDKVTLTFKVLDVFPDAQAATADRAKEFDKQKDVAVKAFETYMAKKSSGMQKTPLGSYIDMKSAGDGPACDSGKLVSLKYRGKLIPSEKQFETNMDGNAPPIEFVVGTGRVIRGWEEALPRFKKGGKGTIYIPADLAYGDQPGPGGQPHQPLMFDIEVIDVKDAPKEMQDPMQGIPQRQPTDTSSHRH